MVSTDVWMSCGDLVGRHSACVVPLHHPDAPLVAACLVRRGAHLFLVAQGPKPALGRGGAKRVRLKPGRVVPFPGCRLEVVSVHLPERTLAVSFGEHPPQELVAPFYSLSGGRRPDLLPGEVPQPDAIIVHCGSLWRISVGGGSYDTLEAGRVWQIAGTTLRSSWVTPLRSSAADVHEPIVIDAPMDVEYVRISRPTRHRVTLNGRPAAALRAVVFGSGSGRYGRRADDASLVSDIGELHYALQAHGLRHDLVRPDGLGGWELFLHAADRVRRSGVKGTG